MRQRLLYLLAVLEAAISDGVALQRERVELGAPHQVVHLRRIGHGNDAAPDERGFLDPVRERLEAGRSPAEEILAHWEGDWRRSLERLIEYSRY